MVDETQPLSSQSSQGTDNILSGPEGETDTMSSQSSPSTLPEKEISIWLDEKEEQHAKRQTFNDTVSTLTDVRRVSPLLSTLNTEWDDISSTQQNITQEKQEKYSLQPFQLCKSRSRRSAVGVTPSRTHVGK